MHSRLILVGPFNGAVQSLALEAKKKYVVGRLSSSDIVVSHSSVSRRHAEVCASAAGVMITDFGSRNGTFVENERIAKAGDVPGQRIRFGEVSFLVAASGNGDICNSEVPTNACAAADARAGAHRLAVNLTPAQARVLDRLVQGVTEKELAAQLRLSESTVHHHIGAIYRAMGVTSRGEFLVKVRPQLQIPTIEYAKKRA
jgi:DNA-binding NarL/FixJ family response regulator